MGPRPCCQCLRVSPHPKLRVWPLEQARTDGVPGLRACDSLYFSSQTEFGFERTTTHGGTTKATTTGDRAKI